MRRDSFDSSSRSTRLPGLNGFSDQLQVSTNESSAVGLMNTLWTRRKRQDSNVFHYELKS